MQTGLSMHLAGAAAGAYAGNAATPSDATPEERLRNIAAGGVTGLLGAHLLTRARRLTPPRN